MTYCPHCTRPYATDKDWKKFGEGEGGHLCWAGEGRHCDVIPEKTWQERAEVAEAKLRELHLLGDRSPHMKHDIPEGQSGPCSCGAWHNATPEEWERCLRLACAIACEHDVGDKSLEFLRKQQSREPGDLVLAIEASMQSEGRSQ